ncbi:LptF/LptG family permease [bacterium]|nr:LptF/LptG family permease [bacterium]
MKVLDRYIIKNLFPPFLGALGVVLFVLVMDFLLDILNLIIAKGVPVWAVGKLFLYNLAWMLSLAIPMASLVASLMAYGRMSEDREIVAARSSGISFPRMMMPGLLIMVLLSAIMVIFNDKVVPEYNYKAKQMMVQIHRKKPLAAIRPRVFIDEFPGIVLYVGDMDDKKKILYDVLIFEKKRGAKSRTIVAPKGKVRYNPEADEISFTLYGGQIHELDPQDPSRYIRIDFDEETIVISELGTKLGEEARTFRGDRELNIAMIKEKIRSYRARIDSALFSLRQIAASAIDSLWVPRTYRGKPGASPTRRALLRERRRAGLIRRQIYVIKQSERRINKLTVEVHKKYALALACIFFFLVSAPLGALIRRGGLGVAVGLAFGFFLTYWAFLIGGEELADRGIVNPIIAMWSGNIVMGIIAVISMLKIIYGTLPNPIRTLKTLLRHRE